MTLLLSSWASDLASPSPSLLVCGDRFQKQPSQWLLDSLQSACFIPSFQRRNPAPSCSLGWSLALSNRMRQRCSASPGSCVRKAHSFHALLPSKKPAAEGDTPARHLSGGQRGSWRRTEEWQQRASTKEMGLDLPISGETQDGTSQT